MHTPSIADTLQRYGQGVAGGLLVSLPLLYTMEIWWTGHLSHPDRLLAILLATLALLTAYQTHAGLRDNQSWQGVVLDSFEVLGLVVLGYLFYLTATSHPSPPLLVVRVGATVQSEGSYQVPITVEVRRPRR